MLSVTISIYVYQVNICRYVVTEVRADIKDLVAIEDAATEAAAQVHSMAWSNVN